MLKKISRKRFLEKYPNFIQASYYKNKYVIPETYENYILGVEWKSTTGLCSSIAKEASKLLRILGYEELFFLGDTTTPWLFREHDYAPVKKALEYLAENKISKSFNGAIRVKMDDFPEFMRHLFWLVRCNGIVIYAHFSDAGFNIIASICQYGNIHLSTLNEEADGALNDALFLTNFFEVPDGQCGGGRVYKRYATSIQRKPAFC